MPDIREHPWRFALALGAIQLVAGLLLRSFLTPNRPFLEFLATVPFGVLVVGALGSIARTGSEPRR